jgi:transcriptional regulator with PAS, ATPase and Fis domain
VIVESPAMRALHALAQRAARGPGSILITGETGVGKEVLAEAIHRWSPRAGGPFLALNCAALSEALVESELFGHERGAFTGAVQTKPGLLEAAAGGTVLLDELGEMPLALQAKLLRVIETRQVFRVGAVRARSIDVRFLAATNRDLDAAVAAGRFRADLFFRLNVINLDIPPLRARPEEIVALAEGFIGRTETADTRALPTLSAGALERLRAYDWPGNIRELRNVIEAAVVLCQGPSITAEHLPGRLGRRERVDSPAVAPAAWHGLDRHQVERAAIIEALARCHGNQTRAAALLGMPRRTLCKRLVTYQIPRPRK